LSLIRTRSPINAAHGSPVREALALRLLGALNTEYVRVQ
jgi:hypothetical protein